jgi:5-methylcytosine-specific restriction endonuclease McrA
VCITFSAPKDVAELWRQTITEVRRVEGRPLQEWEAVERLLDSFVATWDDENAHRIRREHRIIERDGWRCTIPVCSSRQNLHVHHVKFRSRGGSDEEWNLTTLCIPHHQHAVHGLEAGRVRVIGRAPWRLRWELGRWEGGPPALVFEGERRVSLLGRRPADVGEGEDR